jgi:hypothetical protein
MALKSGSLKLLKPFGPVQACNRIALPLPLPRFPELQKAIKVEKGYNKTLRFYDTFVQQPNYLPLITGTYIRL